MFLTSSIQSPMANNQIPMHGFKNEIAQGEKGGEGVHRSENCGRDNWVWQGGKDVGHVIKEGTGELDY
jgi:hypothetical protein